MIKKFFYVISGGLVRFYVLIAIYIISSILELTGIGIIFPYINIVSDPGKAFESEYAPLFEVFHISSNYELIIFVSVGLIFLYIIKNSLLFTAQYQVNHYTYALTQSIRDRLFRAYLAAPYHYHLSKNTADIINNINNEAQRFANGVVRALFTIFSELFFLTLVISAALYAFPKIILFVLFLSCFLYLFYRFTKEKTAAYGTINTDNNIKVLKFVSEAINSLKTTKIHNAEAFFADRVYDCSSRMTSAASKYYSFVQIPKLSVEVLLIVGFSVYITVETMFGGNFTVALPTLATFAAGAIKLIPSTNKLLTAVSTIRYGEVSINKLYEDISEIQDLQLDLDQTDEPLAFNEKLSIKQISYQYQQGDSKALDQVSFEVNKGQSVGIIGASGAGKSTLVDVLLGLLEIQSGDITVDDVSIINNTKNWQTLVAYVPQMIYLLDDTIRHNIAFGVEPSRIDDSLLDEVIETSNLKEVVSRLPEGLDTNIGENGVRLSGGQRQRVGIARALYKKPEILILDEATSALDNETERVISESIDALSRTKTIIIIAHRLTTIKNCDVIFRMENGKIIASGSYQEIVDR